MHGIVITTIIIQHFDNIHVNVYQIDFGISMLIYITTVS